MRREKRRRCNVKGEKNGEDSTSRSSQEGERGGNGNEGGGFDESKLE